MVKQCKTLFSWSQVSESHPLVRLGWKISTKMRRSSWDRLRNSSLAALSTEKLRVLKLKMARFSWKMPVSRLKMPIFLRFRGSRRTANRTLTEGDDALREDIKRRQREAARFIVNAANLIAPVIEKTEVTGYDWVIDSLNHHGFPRIGSELEIAKPLGEKDVESRPLDGMFIDVHRFSWLFIDFPSSGAASSCGGRSSIKPSRCSRSSSAPRDDCSSFVTHVTCAI